MRLELNFKSGKPVYLQIVDQVKTAVASGSLRVGEPLPSIRPLAEQLRVNRNTVAKAYTELETQGVIENRQGKGCFVKENASPYRKQVRRELLITEIDQAIVAAHHLQIEPDEFLSLVEQRLEDFKTRSESAREGQAV
jgi:GntR family transcriptional regulator